jgi:hypothetical protein
VQQGVQVVLIRRPQRPVRPIQPLHRLLERPAGVEAGRPRIGVGQGLGPRRRLEEPGPLVGEEVEVGGQSSIPVEKTGTFS